MPTWLSTSKAAPVSEMLRTRQSIPEPLNVIGPAFRIRRRLCFACCPSKRPPFPLRRLIRIQPLHAIEAADGGDHSQLAALFRTDHVPGPEARLLIADFYRAQGRQRAAPHARLPNHHCRSQSQRFGRSVPILPKDDDFGCRNNCIPSRTRRTGGRRRNIGAGGATCEGDGGRKLGRSTGRAKGFSGLSEGGCPCHPSGRKRPRTEGGGGVHS
jgi:hypothetical protein